MPKGSRANIALWWYAKTPQGWRHYPCIWEKAHGVNQPKHGWVKYKEEAIEFPIGRYELRTFEDGRRVYKPLETCHPREAAMALARARRVADNIGAHNPYHRISTAIAEYLRDLRQRRKPVMEKKARYVLGEFAEFMANPKHTGVIVPLTATRTVTRAIILKFHAFLRKQGNSERTIADKHQRVKAWLRFCKMDTSFMPPVPKFEKTLPTIYDVAQIEAIRGAADDDMRMAIDLCWQLGLREREATHAEWDDIDRSHSVFRVQGKVRKHYKFSVKDSEQREVPIPAALLTRLKERHETHPDTRLIVGNKHDRPEGHLLRKLKALARKAGLNCGRCEGCQRKGSLAECELFELHKFRRTFCTTLLRNLFDLSTVQHIMGHADIATTMAYLRPASSESVQDRMNAIFSDPVKPSRKTARRRARIA